LDSYFSILSILLILSENELSMPLSFLSIKLAAFQASGGAYIRLEGKK
jgi:hypothetical protein